MSEEFAEITALIADRATLFRHGVVGLLKHHRPGWSCDQAGTLEEVQDYLRIDPVDLTLFDLQLGGHDAIAALTSLRCEFPAQPIMVVADTDDRAMILDCLAAGANAYFLKSATLPQLLRAMETVLSGGVFAPAALAGTPHATARSSTDANPLLANLTERQVDVFRLLSEGCATKTIARRLGLAVGTVKVHLAAIYRVLGAHNRVEALAKAHGGSVAHPVAAQVAELLPA